MTRLPSAEVARSPSSSAPQTPTANLFSSTSPSPQSLSSLPSLPSPLLPLPASSSQLAPTQTTEVPAASVLPPPGATGTPPIPPLPQPATEGLVPTRVFVASDMHGEEFPIPDVDVDVAILCGDLTDLSRTPEFETVIKTFASVKAPVKIVIAGNHDWVLESNLLSSKTHQLRSVAKDARPVPDRDTVLEMLANNNIVYMEEESRQFQLENGARLRVYGSPYTPDRRSSQPGFRYKRTIGHVLSVEPPFLLRSFHFSSQGVIFFPFSSPPSP